MSNTTPVTPSNILERAKRLNAGAATSAAYMELGRLANNQAAKLLATRLPLMARGYADTPVGKLLIANLVAMAVGQFRPDDERMATLANAMTVQAYVELMQSFNVEALLDELLSAKSVASALTKVSGAEAD